MHEPETFPFIDQTVEESPAPVEREALLVDLEPAADRTTTR